METLSHVKEVKAIKDHVCSFCNQKIKTGSIYNKSTHKHDGILYDWKTHDYCEKIASILNMYEDADEGVTMDDFMETVNNTYHDLLVGTLPENEISKYSDIIQQLRRVNFIDKLKYLRVYYKTH